MSEKKEDEPSPDLWRPIALLSVSGVSGFLSYWCYSDSAGAMNPGAWLIVVIALALISSLALLSGSAAFWGLWWAQRPSVIAWRKRKQAKKLAKLSKRLHRIVSEIQHLDRLMVRLPLNADWQTIRGEIHYWWWNGLQFAQYARLTLIPFFRSPLALWLYEWVPGERYWLIFFNSWEHQRTHIWRTLKAGSPGWDAETALTLALKLQHEEWSRKRENLLKEAKKLQLRVKALSEELGVEFKDYLTEIDADMESDTESGKIRVKEEGVLPETARAKLAKVRVDIRELREQERALEANILEEEQANAEGPHRKAAGIPDGD